MTEKCGARKDCHRPVTQVYLGVPLCDHHWHLSCIRTWKAETPEADPPCDCGLHETARQRRWSRRPAVAYETKLVDGRRTLVPFGSTQTQETP